MRVALANTLIAALNSYLAAECLADGETLLGGLALISSFACAGMAAAGFLSGEVE